jgi:hypothetical protein
MLVKLDQETIDSLYGLLHRRNLWHYDMDLEEAINALIQDDIKIYRKYDSLLLERDKLEDYANSLAYDKYELKQKVKKLEVK